MKTVEHMETQGRNPHPKKDDPLEQRIRGLIKQEIFTTPRGRQMFSQVDVLQREYFRDCLSRLDDTKYIHDATQSLLRRLSEVTNSKIVEGEDHLAGLKKGSPAFAIVNHFSAYKLITIEDKDLGFDFPDDREIYPFPIFFSPVYPVAERLGDNLYDAHLELPGSLARIQEAAGLLVIPKDNGVFGSTKDRTEELIQRHPNSLTVIFSEGETSGKRNKGGSYDLVKFHGGSFAIAEELGIPVIPVCQYFNPGSGYEIGILPPVRFDNPPSIENEDARRKYFRGAAQATRRNMQAWLDQRQK